LNGNSVVVCDADGGGFVVLYQCREQETRE